MTADSTADFYDQLAPYYHLLYGDWERAVSVGRAARAGAPLVIAGARAADRHVSRGSASAAQ